MHHCKHILLAALALLCWHLSTAQFTDNFSDGNFSDNPAWAGNTDAWIVNSEQQLQSNSTTANSNFFITTANTLATAAQWDFWARLAFNPSGANFVDVYLTASSANLGLAATTGYFVRLGDTPDEISLYRKDATGQVTKIIDGTDGLLNSSNNVVRVRVIRNAANQWSLQRDVGATGTYVPEGTATDATYTSSAFFGIWVRQSTATFFQRHFLDDIEVKPYSPDTTPPQLVSATAASATSVDVLFSEAINNSDALNTANYSVNNGVGQPATAAFVPGSPLAVRLAFASSFPNGVNLTLTATNIRDLAGNAMASGSAGFSFYTPQRYDIVIHEMMVNPNPPVGLPNANWVELRNTARFPINLQGYRLVRSTGSSGPMPAFVLQPDSMVLVATASQVAVLSAFGPTLAVTSFPTLPNAGDLLWLNDGNGALMHAVDYRQSWYQNAVKANGGWTLEMIDARNACSGASNWRASVHPSGGTPGRANSIAAPNPDATAPVLVRAFAPNANTIELTFNEPLDSSLSAAATYSISNGIGAAGNASLVPPAFTTVRLSLANALQPGTVYTLTASNVRDCAGNAIGSDNTARVGLAAPVDTGDLVVNEILFNPPPLGVDYLEVFNRSNKIINLGSLFFTNRSSTTGALGTLIPLSTVNRLLFPGAYYVVTENPELVAQQFTVRDPSVVASSSMPSFPNSSGTAVLLSNNGLLVDELNYDERWHFALVDNRAGISLERINPNSRTQLTENWTSAAASAGFGTPGYQNSQFRANEAPPTGSIRLNPPLFSPDNDGFEDFTLIEFEFGEPGNVANVTIMDAAGRPVRVLQRNTTIAARGSFRWDGLNDRQQRVPVGNYVVFFEIFNLRGQKQAFKKGVTVARRF